MSVEKIIIGNHCQIVMKIIKLNAINILKSTNNYHQKIIEKSSHKMNLYPAMCWIPYKKLNHQN